MTRKIVKRALILASGGDLEAAMACLAVAESGFVRRRLAHYREHGGIHRDAAIRLTGEIERRSPPAAGRHIQPDRTDIVASAPGAPDRIDVTDPSPFLLWACRGSDAEVLDLDRLRYAQVWGLVALAALMRKEGAGRVEPGRTSSTSKFARALGLERAVAGAAEAASTPEPARTVPLRVVHDRNQIEPAAERMAQLIVPHASDVDRRRTIRYVLVELLRNVVQHSEDAAGGVVACQLNNQGPYTERPMIQVAVADTGIGIPESLRRMHDVPDARVALERSLWPHISGTFVQGLSGSFENAGPGLFYIAELTKLTGGRLLVATRSASLEITTGSLLSHDPSTVRFLGDNVGFPGTLVVFEVPVSAEVDYASVMKTIARRAIERTPERASNQWLTYGPAPDDALRVVVAELAENTLRAAETARDTIEPAVIRRQPVELDFRGREICTQSYLHALLFEVLRLAWARRTPIHVLNADAAIQSGLDLVESYSLGG